MNERIEQLVDRCTRQAMWPGDPDAGELNAEMFAKLIVKECARVAFESDLKMAIGQWGADSAILKHFGIKE